MIILSQDKTEILNFDNIEVIGIGNPLENNDGKFQILVDTTNDNEFTIAEYETEERAKEVLEVIFDFFEVSQRMCNSDFFFRKNIYLQNARKIGGKLCIL